MATSSLYGSVSESTGLYGIGAASGGTYFEWFIFFDSATAPATPTGGSWSFSTNTGTAPSGWLNAPPASPTNQVWVSIAVVDSRSASALTWSVPGLMTGAGLPILTGSGAPSAGTGLNGQLYINTATNPQSMFNKQAGAWVQLTGSSIYATAGANTNITSLTGLTGSIATPDNIQFDTNASSPIAVGNLRWNNTTKTMSFGIVDGTDEVNIGEQMVAYVTNAEATTITRGQAVYLYQAQGNRASVKLAYNTGDATSAKTLGLALQDIPANNAGFIMTQGVLDKINTNSFAEGATLYLGETPGSLTATKPQAPNHLVYIGVVERSNAGNGQIYVKPQNGYELDELHDVRITNVQNGNYLKYDSTVPAWVNVSGPTGTLVGTTDTQTLTNKTISGSSNTITNIGNASLTNSSLTINGNPVSLGGSTTITAATPNELIFGTGLTSTSNFDGSQETTVTLNAVGTAGVYGSAGTTPQITVNTVGQVTNITPLDIVITTNNISGSVAIDQGGTGASSKKYAMQNLLPDYAGNNGKVLAIDAAGTDLEWRAVTGVGTVTSVNGSGGTTGLTLTGGPITAAGTLTLGGTLAVANGGTSAVNATDARSNLGLGSIATQNANSVSITGGSITGITDLAIADGGTGASTAADARTNLGLGSAAVLNAGVAGGVATLDGGGTVPTSQLPAAVLGAVKYQGAWDASTNTPTLTSSTGTQGYYYVVSVAGSTDLNGITDWKVGDWAIYNGSVWQKIDNTDQVTSVNGYTGIVSLSYSDVGAPSTSGTNATGTWGINVTGNAGTVTNGVYTTGDQTIGGNKTFSNTITGSVSGNAGTVTNGVYTTGDQTIGGTKTFSSTITGSISGNAGTVTNGVYTTGSYADPSWITSIAGSKVSGDISGNAATATTATNVSGGTASVTTLTTSSTVTLNGGTANGVAYLNGSKVLTTGSALTFDGSVFTAVGADGALGIVSKSTSGGIALLPYLDSTNGAKLAAYNAAISAFSHLTIDGTYLRFNTSNAEQMRLDSTGLGIGTSSPSQKLHVVGNIDAVSSANVGSAGSAIYYLGGANAPTDAEFKYNTASRNLTWKTAAAASDMLTLDASGNLGLGVTPSAWFSTWRALQIGASGSLSSRSDVFGTILSNNAFINSAGNNAYIGTGTAAQYGLIGNEHRWLTAASGTAGDTITFTQAMTLDASGNLLIGRTSGVYRIDAAHASAGEIARFSYTGGSKSPYIAAIAQSDTVMFLDAQNSDNTVALGIRVSGAERARIDSSGNFGLGVTPSAGSTHIDVSNGGAYFGLGNGAQVAGNAYFSSSQWLYKAAASTPSARIDVNAGNNGSIGFFTGTAGTAGNAISFTQAMTLDASGNLGIGTTSPEANGRLTVDRSGSNYIMIRASGTNKLSLYADASASVVDAQANYLAFNAGSAERARIDSSGAFLVGKTAATYTVDGVSLLNTGSNFSYTSSTVIAVNRNGTDGAAIDFYKAGTQVGSISVTGSATAYNTSSDYRLKENIQPMTGALAKVAQLKPCTYNWKADGSAGEGFIAHELQAVVPQCVTGEKDAVDAEGKPVYQGIDTSFLVATLTAAIQELKAEFDAYKATHP